MKVVNKYTGSIRLKTDLPSPNNYFKIQPGIPLTKSIGLPSFRNITISAFTVLTNKRIYINGYLLFLLTPSIDPQTPYVSLTVTEEPGTFLDNVFAVYKQRHA